MKVVSIGGGPAGLYLAILLKRANPADEVVVYERNQADDTFGFGVVFSDATLGNLARADQASYERIQAQFAHWDDIEVHYAGQVVRSTGHGFAGMGRHALLSVLQDRCHELGVTLRFGQEVAKLDGFADADLIVAADGVNSTIRGRYADDFRPEIDFRPNRFVWLGTTAAFPAFTFYFKRNQHGLWRVHAYRYGPDQSTFIVECTQQTLAATGLQSTDEDATVAYMQQLFADELQGHRLLKNRSIWRSFPVVRNQCWHRGNLVLLGDAAHTAHFSVGSGTKIAMEDAIALDEALRAEPDVAGALSRYEAERRPAIDSLQRAAQVSLEWFEHTERYMKLEPLQFASSLLTRSLRVTHDNLKVRDPKLGEQVERWFAAGAARQSGRPVPTAGVPPMFTPFRVRDLVLENRVVVSPMCQYFARDGTVDDWHLVHLGSRAIGGAGLVMTEMTDVSADGRISPGCAGLYAPEHTAAWKRIVDFVHTHSAAKIGVQLGHAGRKGSTREPWHGEHQPLERDNWPLLAPSALPYHDGSHKPREMTRADMDQVRDQFVGAAGMADQAGFDVLELHCAHGYLLASFLSPLTNRRTDAYGGTVDRRLRFPLEVFCAVRAVWPAGKPMFVRISATDWAPGGLSAADVVAVARLFKDHGCDLIDVSAGQTVAHAQPRYGRLYQTPFSDLIRHEADVATMTVGNVSSYADINSVLVAGRADLVAIARGHLYDPYFTRHAAQAQNYALPWPKPYSPVRRFTPR
jgi:anthraniloyl-CoA monooxygenase